MEKDLSSYRKSYDKDRLLDDHVEETPLPLFEKWFLQAKESTDVIEANAMNLATIGVDGYPKTRIVLLKEIENNDFIFYTNYNSEKALAIAATPRGCLHFFWPSMERQVIIKVDLKKVSRKKSENYFKSRPEGSQIGAWASNQSATVDSREKLDEQLRYFKDKFKDTKIPVPEFWGGYRAMPISFEFWQGRPNRMHDRMYYLKNGGEWIRTRLAP